MNEATLYVVQNDGTDPRAKYQERAGYRIDQTCTLGDKILDRLIVYRLDGGKKFAVRSLKALTNGSSWTLSSAWNWGDQYEPDAEIALTAECLRCLFDGQQTSYCPGILEHGPLFPLRWSIDESREGGGDLDFEV